MFSTAPGFRGGLYMPIGHSVWKDYLLYLLANLIKPMRV